MPTRVNVRELKSRLSEYLRRVKAGEIVEVAERGTPIGRILPAGQPLADRLDAMREAGLIQWSKRALKPLAPVARVRGRRSVTQLLIEGRQ